MRSFGVIMTLGSMLVLPAIAVILPGGVLLGRHTADPDVSGAFASSDHDLIGDGSGSNLASGVRGDQVGSAASPIDPLLGPPQNNGGPTQTMALLPGSPAIAAGGAVTTLTQAAGATATTLFVQNPAAIASTNKLRRLMPRTTSPPSPHDAGRRRRCKTRRRCRSRRCCPRHPDRS